MTRINANYSRAKAFAYMAFEQHNIQNFPIDILSILESYEDVKIISYSEMAEKRNCTFEEIINVNNSEDGVIHYSADRDKYFIAYNDKVAVKERMYWTLAHELGHYLLGHHKESGRSSLSRNEMTDPEFEVFEVEADFFARFFVSPPAIISEANIIDHNKVKAFFGISYSAAKSTVKYIKNSFKKGFRFAIPTNVSDSFSKLIFKARYGKTCSTCDNCFYIQGSTFCPVCGSDQLHNFAKGEDLTMKYTAVTLNEVSRAIQCPRCGNEEVKGKYCNVCSTYLFNKCTGYRDTDQYFQNQTEKWHLNDNGCGEILEGDARYCHECGCTSTFYEDGLLEHWWNDNKQHQAAATLDIKDDDLPF